MAPARQALNSAPILSPVGAVKPASSIGDVQATPSAAKPTADIIVADQLEQSIAKLGINDEAHKESVLEIPPKALPGTSEALKLDSSFESTTMDDGTNQTSVSSTKAASSDGKSITSGAAFGLDEKESIRPDDSASVQAADVEDDDSNSSQGSRIASSGRVSEAGAKAFSEQFHEISETMAVPPSHPPTGKVLLPAALGEIANAQLALGSAPIVTNSIVAPTTAAEIPQLSLQYHEPDEKLLEALESPKDRLFLLQLEQQFISFISDSKENTLELPPCNSFCRLLAHRLGDYYRLLHFVDNSVSAVRLYKNNSALLPTPLSAFTRTESSNDGQTAAQRSMKIMRRAGLAVDGRKIESTSNTTASSVDASKTGSETGDGSAQASGMTSPTGSLIAKDKSSQTREEREAKYKEARDRIFADWKEIDAVDSGPSKENSNDVSRASSTSGKKKKKKDKSAAKDGDTAASKDGEPATANGNGVAPVPQSKPTEEEQNQPPEPAIEVSRRHMSQVWAPILALRRHSWSANLCT